MREVALALDFLASQSTEGLVRLFWFTITLEIPRYICGFIALGIWVGRKLTPQPRPIEFQRNDAAIRSLGLTERECEILGALASGQSNKQLARSFAISPNTVKTHVARVFEKLEVQNRMQAVEKARWLALIP